MFNLCSLRMPSLRKLRRKVEHHRPLRRRVLCLIWAPTRARGSRLFSDESYDLHPQSSAHLHSLPSPCHLSLFVNPFNTNNNGCLIDELTQELESWEKSIQEVIDDKVQEAQVSVHHGVSDLVNDSALPRGPHQQVAGAIQMYALPPFRPTWDNPPFV